MHLAAHAVVRPGLPHLSHVVLAGDDGLAVADLLGPDFTGDLLVLSACQTGEGTPPLAAPDLAHGWAAFAHIGT